MTTRLLVLACAALPLLHPAESNAASPLKRLTTRWARLQSSHIVPPKPVAPQRDLIREMIASNPQIMAKAEHLRDWLRPEVAKVAQDNKRLLRWSNAGASAVAASAVLAYVVMTKAGLVPAMASSVPLMLTAMPVTAKSETRAKTNYHDLWSATIREGERRGLSAPEVERIAADLIHPLAKQINRNFGVRLMRLFFDSAPQDAGIEQIGR